MEDCLYKLQQGFEEETKRLLGIQDGSTAEDLVLLDVVNASFSNSLPENSSDYDLFAALEVETKKTLLPDHLAQYRSSSEESIRASISRLEQLASCVDELGALQNLINEYAYCSSPQLLRRTIKQMQKVMKDTQRACSMLSSLENKSK